MNALKWVGFALVATALAVLPFTVWISARWGIVSATAGVIGIVLLTIGLASRRPEIGPGDPNVDVPPGPGGKELRGFPGAKGFDRHDGDD
jgi:hypothetical protein